MKKCQQIRSRKQAQRLARLEAQYRRQIRWWKQVLVAPLKRARRNNRANRRDRYRYLTR